MDALNIIFLNHQRTLTICMRTLLSVKIPNFGQMSGYLCLIIDYLLVCEN
ncbi:unnamed protein product [Larinioides sclopetarius]|uniref:Uncharacterized protein n=1 Tax=Larinioides sclopetarius TaxID=280406 RepID=A0AAV1ZF73_9ARAC